MFKLFRVPVDSEVVVIAADPADGGADFCAAVAKSKKHNDTFMNFHARMEGSQFGYELYKMALFIQKCTGRFPMIGVERNTGGATISVLKTLNYPHLFKMQSFDTVEKTEATRIGWVTNTQTRMKMLDDLALSLRQHLNQIFDIEEIQEFMRFIRQGRTGRPEAAPGAHDDYTIAEAIGWQMLQIAASQAPESLAQIAKGFPSNDLPDFAK